MFWTLNADKQISDYSEFSIRQLNNAIKHFCIKQLKLILIYSRQLLEAVEYSRKFSLTRSHYVRLSDLLSKWVDFFFSKCEILFYRRSCKYAGIVLWLKDWFIHCFLWYIWFHKVLKHLPTVMNVSQVVFSYI